MFNRPPLQDTIDFQLTDLEDARLSLAQLPVGLVEAQRAVPEHCMRLRRALLPTDRALTGRAMDWVVHLPPEVRPNTLCEKYPRIANAIASAADSPPHLRSMLRSLLTDRRGQRQGFPVNVRVEIERLLSLSQSGDLGSQ